MNCGAGCCCITRYRSWDKEIIFIQLYFTYKDYKTITLSTMMRSNRSNINVLGITETGQRHNLFKKDTGCFKKMWKSIIAAFDMALVVIVKTCMNKQSTMQCECLPLTATTAWSSLFQNPLLDWKVYSDLQMLSLLVLFLPWSLINSKSHLTYCYEENMPLVLK